MSNAQQLVKNYKNAYRKTVTLLKRLTNVEHDKTIIAFEKRKLKYSKAFVALLSSTIVFSKKFFIALLSLVINFTKKFVVVMFSPITTSIEKTIIND